jgi:hypothetical protein
MVKATNRQVNDLSAVASGEGGSFAKLKLEQRDLIYLA